MTAADPFADVPEPLRPALRRRGFTGLTAVQQAVLVDEAAGRNLRISSETGSGKTVALGFVLAHHLLVEARLAGPSGRKGGPAALVIAPTRELATQVGAELEWLYEDLPALRVEVVTGGTDLRGERRRLAGRPAVVVGTPGRLLDHMTAGALASDRIRDVVLDEADQMLDMGFKDELDAILERLPAERASHMVSATFPDPVLRLAERFQADALAVEGTRLGVANADIEHVVHAIRPAERHAALVNLLLSEHGGRCLVFVQRRVEAAAMADRLADEGFAVLPFSGDLAQAQRTRTLNAFKRGVVRILISTDVAARGIDVPDISAVIHAEPPGSAEVYTHRSGRTGRAGNPGRSLLLVHHRAEGYVRRVLAEAGVEAAWRPVPDGSAIHRSIARAVAARLGELLGGTPAAVAARRKDAAGLLEGKDPVDVVAALLELAGSELPREPYELSTIASPPAAVGRRGDHRAFVRFFINWGERKGANTGRLLAHVCRRGGLTGRQVGSIRIGEWSSTFDVDKDAVAVFEDRVRRPDEREPELRITRYRETRTSRRGGGG